MTAATSTQLQRQAAFEASLLGFLYRQFTAPKAIPAHTNLSGQVAIVTGSNVGLGLEASRQLLRLGLAHLVMAVRSQARGDAAAEQLRREFPASTVSVWLVDMISYDSICAFAKRCDALPRLDMAILNAGLMETHFALDPATEHERTLQVNYLSTALLSILLLPVLQANRAPGAGPPVLTIVGSDMAYTSDIATTGPVLRQLDTSRGFSGLGWYGKTKLLLALFVSKLAELVDSQHVVINLVNPGMTKDTAFFRDAPSVLVTAMAVLQWLLARSLHVAASTYIDAAAVRGAASHGAFLSDWDEKPYPKMCYTPEGSRVRDRLWDETMEELNFVGAARTVKALSDGHSAA